MPHGSAFVFGPFHFDPVAPQLHRQGKAVPLTLRQLQLLHVFVSRPGELIGKTQLIEAAWKDVAVADNTLSKVVSTLRDAITIKGSPCTITNQHGHGYRFTGPVERVADRRDVDIEALLAPHRAFIEGRAALETLKRDRIDDARRVFGALVAQHPADATMHVGLANGCVLAFEATRADAAPDVAALRTAVTDAREACSLNPDYAEAWATLGFVLERTGDRADAVAALTRAVTLDPQNWRHHLRLSYGSWGEQRLAAARLTLVLLPGCPMARLLAATVFVARGRLAQAEREIDAGLAVVSAASEMFSPVALHWLKGLLLLARGCEDEALESFRRELDNEASGHLYARECSANTWYAIGACHLRRGDVDAASAAFDQAIVRVPRHPTAHAGRVLIHASVDPARTRDVGNGSPSVDAAIAHAVLLEAAGDIVGAAQLLSAALAQAPPGSAGWLLPIEPVLALHRHPIAFGPVLAALCGRAS